METEIAIQAVGLGKSYYIGHVDTNASHTLRDDIIRTLRNSGRRLRDLFAGNALIAGDTVEEFRALDDVSFSVAKGEIVGVIGHNGAGKSTLLKILSRITEPTTGRIEISGRVASLLEVGTGFHPELTGRENIYLNGAILGMSRAEIRRKFDEIVEFAGVGQFLDTPVKRYSSGMYVRLAFSVAAHLEPEILIIDEVLAVGDAEFQKKCLGKMGQVARSGRTVIFVSHNIPSVVALCSRCIALERGKVKEIGDTRVVTSNFLASQSRGSGAGMERHDSISSKDAPAQIASCEIDTDSDQRIVPFGNAIRLKVAFEARESIPDLNIVAGVDTIDGTRIATTRSEPGIGNSGAASDVVQTVTGEFLDLRLAPGTYSFSVALRRGNATIDLVKGAAQFQVVPISQESQDDLTSLKAGFIFSKSAWMGEDEQSS